MTEQLLVFDRSKGEWFESGCICSRSAEDPTCSNRFVMSHAGVRVIPESGIKWGADRHILTPCAAPKEYELGASIRKAFDSNVWDRLTSEFRPPVHGSHEWFIGALGEVLESDKSTSDIPRFILSPPEPEPKTADELLADIIRTHENGSGSSEYMAFTYAIEAGRKYGERTKP